MLDCSALVCARTFAVLVEEFTVELGQCVFLHMEPTVPTVLVPLP